MTDIWGWVGFGASLISAIIVFGAPALRKWRFRRWARSLHLKPIRIKGGLEIKHLHSVQSWGEGVVFITYFEDPRLFIRPVTDSAAYVTLPFNRRKDVVPLTDEEIVEEMLFKTPVARALEQTKERNF